MSSRRIMGRNSLEVARATSANDSAPGMVGFSAVRMILLLAYVDPGSAGFIITTVLGVLAAGGYLARAFLNRLKHWIFRRNRGMRREEVSSSADDQANDR